MALHVEVVSPERILYSGEAEMVICRTEDGGDIAFLTGHAPFLGALAIWKVEIVAGDGERVTAAVYGGFVEVSHDRVTILSDQAELAPDIDVAEARRLLEDAERQLATQPDAAIEAQVRRAHVALEVAGGLGPPSRAQA